MGRDKLGGEEEDTIIAEGTNGQWLGDVTATACDMCRELQAV